MRGVHGSPATDDAVMTGFVDLHTHSTASDGALAPAAVVETAAVAGLVALALTDHDTLAGVAEAREAGARLGIRIIAGVELSVMDGEREVHLLGLHVARADALEEKLSVIRATRRTRATHIVDKLNALGVPVTAEAVFAQAGSGVVGRPHVARALIAGGWVRDQREAFERYLGAGRPANIDKERITFAEGAQLIHECGGLAVMAHPGPDGRRERIEPLAALGLDGIEVLHPGHSGEDVARLSALADFLTLVPSGGSDWHGASVGQRQLGCMKVPAEWLLRQDARLTAGPKSSAVPVR
jgi:predicted metal-dependent phosphoesterase TrpH